MKASEIIAVLEKAIKEHGDLPCFTENGDIERIDVFPTVDGVEYLGGEVASPPAEFTLIFHETM